jgi:hypothetical protein
MRPLLQPQKARLPRKILSSLNQRTIALFEERGYRCDTVESYNAFTRRKKDLFGLFDIVAIGKGETVAIQLTSKSNMSARVKKISNSEILPELLRSNWKIYVIGWFKKPNGRYDYKEFEF